MVGGFARDRAVQDQIDATVDDAIERARSELPQRDSLSHCIAISDHPRIPADQVQLVAQELGPEMPAFKQLDTVVHDLSLEISAAAEARDRDAAITAYQQMLDGCFQCHAAYKERVAVVLQKIP